MVLGQLEEAQNANHGEKFHQVLGCLVAKQASQNGIRVKTV
jgi:hypothetical protein